MDAPSEDPGQKDTITRVEDASKNLGPCHAPEHLMLSVWQNFPHQMAASSPNPFSSNP